MFSNRKQMYILHKIQLLVSRAMTRSCTIHLQVNSNRHFIFRYFKIISKYVCLFRVLQISHDRQVVQGYICYLGLPVGCLHTIWPQHEDFMCVNMSPIYFHLGNIYNLLFGWVLKLFFLPRVFVLLNINVIEVDHRTY